MITSNNNKLIKQIADEFNKDFSSLPVTVLPNDDVVFKNYLIKKTKFGNWELVDIENHFIISTFYLRSCALLGASYYSQHLFNMHRDIKFFDREYNKNKNDSVLFKHHLKQSTDFDQKVIFLNRLECSEAGANYYRCKISSLFKRAFV